MNRLSLIIHYSLISATVRYSTPILYTALGALITQQADILNIGVEGMMLAGAFTAIAVSYFSGSWLLAVLGAMLVGVLLAVLMALAHLRYGANIIVAGVAINLLALALTRFLLNNILHASGVFRSPKLAAIPKVHLDFLTRSEILSSLFNNYSVFELVGILLVFLVWYYLYRTVPGLHIRSVGLFPMAAETAGIDVYRTKFRTMVMSGVLGGVGGAHLSLGYSRLFVENMTAGRGLMGVAAMFFGGGNPIRTWLGCLIFGFVDSVGSRLQPYGLPNQFVLMFPYLATVLVLALTMARRVRAERLARSSLRITTLRSDGETS